MRLTRVPLYGRILKANLSWTRKKSNSSDAKILSSVFISFFQIHKFEFVRLSEGRTTD